MSAPQATNGPTYTVVNLDKEHGCLPLMIEKDTLGEALRWARLEANRHGWPHQVAVYPVSIAAATAWYRTPSEHTALPEPVWLSLEDTAQTIDDLLLSRTDWHWLVNGSLHEFHGEQAVRDADRDEDSAIELLSQ